MSDRARGWTIEWAKLSQEERADYVQRHRCEHCRALEWQPCVTPRGFPTALPHASRMGRGMLALSRDLMEKNRETVGAQE